MASLVANQFVPMPDVPDAPAVRTINGNPSDGPFGPFESSAFTQPLDPNWYGGSPAWGYWGPGFVNSFPVGKRGFGFGGGYRDGGRRSGNITNPPGAAQRSWFTLRPGASAPPPAPAGTTRLAGNAAAVRRSVPR
jgi:hypothetical protein